MAINSDTSDPYRTHEPRPHYERHGFAGRVERGVEMLMRRAPSSSMHKSVRVQGVGVLRDIFAALIASGEDPEACVRQALAHGDEPEERAALRELVKLKDGPRDDDYRERKDAAWDRGRELIDHGPVGSERA